MHDIIMVASLPILSVCLFDRATFDPFRASSGYANTRNGYFRRGNQPKIETESVVNVKLIIIIIITGLKTCTIHAQASTFVIWTNV